MIFSFLKSLKNNRVAARNFRVLSALDDEMLRDIGLDRDTLRTFCENGCTFRSTPTPQPEAPWSAVMPTALGTALR